MTELETMRMNILKYCQTNECDNCPLEGYQWDHANLLSDGKYCPSFSSLTETECNKAMELIEKNGQRTKNVSPIITNNVEHPNHYQGKHECIDVMVAMFGVDAVIDFCKCNIFKYRFRADKKNGAEDIKKAEWYESKLMELQNK